MYNKNLYDNVIKGDIQNSLHNICIILSNNENINELEDTLIYICSYIGSFISIYDIKKYNDLILNTKNIIENDTINITIFLSLITKMCILCDIYNKHPIIKTGILPIKNLREKVIDVFDNDTKLS